MARAGVIERCRIAILTENLAKSRNVLGVARAPQTHEYNTEAPPRTIARARQWVSLNSLSQPSK
jgi:hypothetical protein